MVGVSFDDEASHKAFAEKHNLPFSLIADTDKRIAQAYGVTGGLLRGLIGIPQRVTFVIDKAGVVRGVFHHELAVENHLDDVRATLKTLSQD